MVAIPHIVARNIPSHAVLDDMLARLAGEAGVDRAHVVGGDRDNPAGEFDSALQLLETGLFAKYGINRIALACYPEGHPRISDEVLEQARIDKMRAAAEQGLQVWMVSQFAFEAPPIIALARRMRAQGIDVPYRVGIAGPASHATLLKYAMLCGVGTSLRALRERRGLATLGAGRRHARGRCSPRSPWRARPSRRWALPASTSSPSARWCRPPNGWRACGD